MRFALIVTLVVSLLGCSGMPISVQVGNAKLELGTESEASTPVAANVVTAEAAPPEPEVAPPPAVAPPRTTVAAKATPKTKKPAGVGPGQIQVVTGRGITPRVDGKLMASTTQGHFIEVPAGERTLVIHNLLGSPKATVLIDVKPGRRHVFNWDGRVVGDAGERAAAPMPTAINYNSDVVISGLIVMAEQTEVVIGGRTAIRTGNSEYRLADVRSGRQPVRIVSGGYELYNGAITVGMAGETRCGFVTGGGKWNADCEHFSR